MKEHCKINRCKPRNNQIHYEDWECNFLKVSPKLLNHKKKKLHLSEKHPDVGGNIFHRNIDNDIPGNRASYRRDRHVVENLKLFILKVKQNWYNPSKNCSVHKRRQRGASSAVVIPECKRGSNFCCDFLGITKVNPWGNLKLPQYLFWSRAEHVSSETSAVTDQLTWSLQRNFKRTF